MSDVAHLFREFLQGCLEGLFALSLFVVYIIKGRAL